MTEIVVLKKVFRDMRDRIKLSSVKVFDQGFGYVTSVASDGRRSENLGWRVVLRRAAQYGQSQSE
jgi:hypothetical protein